MPKISADYQEVSHLYHKRTNLSRAENNNRNFPRTYLTKPPAPPSYPISGTNPYFTNTKSDPYSATDTRVVARPLYKIRQASSQGNGLYSTQSIPKGKLILKESPFLVLPLYNNGENPPKELYHKAYHRLSPEYKTLFWSLYQRKDDDSEKSQSMNVINTNSIPFSRRHEYDEMEEKVNSLGLFRTLSRINHCCRPNAGWYWYQEDNQMRLYAYTDITPNEQITVSYLSHDDLLLPSIKRRKALLDGFGFECTCSACNLAWSAPLPQSEWNIRKYQFYRSKWTNQHILDYAANFSQSLAQLGTSLDILSSERLFDQMGEVYEKIYEVYAVHGIFHKAKAAARDLLQHYKVVMGFREANKTWVASQANDPTKYPLWAKLAKASSRQGRRKR
ncbi:uncharacterized protein IL334_006445 [Kwoniella shivajii]|uniref:SET domain-containing protein n=1 Tax=Kwoniella shivajii TaxID=564305 RepID=A0ABZ1D601_9TREE|nr:hypothetical protein IL334_006445 [Kwoniella shivajii]